MNCKTCETIDFWNTNRSHQGFEDKLFAKISIYTWKTGERKIKGNQKSTITTKAFNFLKTFNQSLILGANIGLSINAQASSRIIIVGVPSKELLIL